MASGSSLRALAIWVAVMVGAMAGPAFAQTGAASVTGLIIDESGAPVPGVTITATNQATNVTYTAVSNEAGNYTIAALPIGTYVVKAELTGFRTLTRTPTTFEAQQIARLDFRMSVGQIQESVEVSGTPPILQTETATVGEVISGNTAQSLPLNGRNIGQLALTLPGTVTYNPRGFTNIGSVNMNRPFVNGNREQTNNFTVDGLDVNESIDNRVAYQPIPDAVAEISVETNNYAADMGNVGGAVVSSVIKSGSNQLRGSVFEFYRNSDFDANTWENNFASAPKQERKQHIYGGTIGGPLVKNSLFFFADYQGSRQDAPGFGTISVAPAAWRARRPVERVDADHRSADRPAVPRQPDSDRALRRAGAGAVERYRQLSAAEPRRPRRHHQQLRRRDPARGFAPTRATPASTGAGRPTTSSSAATRSRPTKTGATSSRSRWCSPPATTSRSTTSPSTGTASSGRR